TEVWFSSRAIVYSRTRVLARNGTPKQLNVTRLNEETWEYVSLSISATSSKSTSILSSRQVKVYSRYGIWLGLLGAANANRLCFGLATTWLPHLLGNTIALLLPEIYQLLDRSFGLERRLNRRDQP